MTWINIGDINPKSGTTMVRDLELDDSGDFSATAIEVTPESHVGGCEDVFLIRSGELFVSQKNLNSALKAVGARLEGEMILRPGQNGLDERFHLRSEEGLLELAQAANAYSGVEDHDAPLVRLEVPSRYDPDPRFDGDLYLFSRETSLWAVIRNICDGFDYQPEDDPKKAVLLNTWDSPFQNMPRSVDTRADLAQIRAFRELERDENGNPIVYDGEAWIGPEEPSLIEMWEELPDQEAPSAEMEPGF